jgi:peptide/nickel transport system substrate-binding protein
MFDNLIRRDPRDGGKAVIPDLAHSFNQSVIHATYTNTRKQPLADPRVRRAMHLALDRPTLIEAIKDVAPMQIGGFMYPFSDLATPKAELVKRLGYQDDPTAAEKEAKALMAAAGHPNGIQGLDYLVRDSPAITSGRRRSRRCCSRR